MARAPRALVAQPELTREVARARKALNSRDVRDVRFSLGTDSGGEAAIFFLISLTKDGTDELRMPQVTRDVATTLFDRLQPYNRWGLQPYFNFTAGPVAAGESE